MRPILCIILLICSISLVAQNQKDCEQLGIQFNGIVQDGHSKQLSFDVSNMLYMGHLYYYPGLVLLSETGDTIAKESVDYYGIGSNFQTHLLDIKTEISFPFKGELLLFGSYYQNLFCRFPFEMSNAEFIDSNVSEVPSPIVAPNIAKDHILVDLSDLVVNAISVEYFINVTNEKEQVVFDVTTDLNYVVIPTEALKEKGYYYISIWDNIQQILLPVQVIWME